MNEKYTLHFIHFGLIPPIQFKSHLFKAIYKTQALGQAGSEWKSPLLSVQVAPRPLSPRGHRAAVFNLLGWCSLCQWRRCNFSAGCCGKPKKGQIMAGKWERWEGWVWLEWNLWLRSKCQLAPDTPNVISVPCSRVETWQVLPARDKPNKTKHRLEGMKLCTWNRDVAMEKNEHKNPRQGSQPVSILICWQGLWARQGWHFALIPCEGWVDDTLQGFWQHFSCKLYF